MNEVSNIQINTFPFGKTFQHKKNIVAWHLAYQMQIFLEKMLQDLSHRHRHHHHLISSKISIATRKDTEQQNKKGNH